MISRTTAVRVNNEALGTDLPILHETMKAQFVPAADRIGIDVVSARHHTLFDAQLIEAWKRCEQEDERYRIAFILRPMDESEKDPARQRGFDRERLALLKNAQPLSEKPAASLDCDCLHIRSVHFPRDIIGIEKCVLIYESSQV